MTKINLIEILTLIIATVILLLALFSATFDGGEFINFDFNKLFGKISLSTLNSFIDTASVNANSMIVR